MKGRRPFNCAMPAQAGTQVTYQRRRATSMRQTLMARYPAVCAPSMGGVLLVWTAPPNGIAVPE
jgi:hypothetical protein